jgi:hypothetical protein
MPAVASRVVPDPSLPGLYHVECVAALQLIPSPLRPNCPANQRLFCWRGVHPAPSPVIDHPLLRQLAIQASLQDPGSYGSGLRKFHIFCDVFSIPEPARLPASTELIYSFLLWAVSDPDPSDPLVQDGTLFETVSIATARKYMSAIRAWHIAQNWPPPLSEASTALILAGIRGMDNIQAGSRRRPMCPPITLVMMHTLRAILNLSDPFDACLWAQCTCAFFGLMHFGEVSVPTRAAFRINKHLSRGSLHFGTDLTGRLYARLRLPSAKTARAGESKDVFLVEQSGLCPLEALHNLISLIPAPSDAPLFSWRDSRGTIRTTIKSTALSKINSILSAAGFGNAFGHSFHIGGASFYLAKGVSPEIVRIHGRWKSLAYEVYIRSFEQIASTHLANQV